MVLWKSCEQPWTWILKTSLQWLLDFCFGHYDFAIQCFNRLLTTTWGCCLEGWNRDQGFNFASCLWNMTLYNKFKNFKWKSRCFPLPIIWNPFFKHITWYKLFIVVEVRVACALYKIAQGCNMLICNEMFVVGQWIISLVIWKIIITNHLFFQEIHCLAIWK
jgi:hypothetical protein